MLTILGDIMDEIKIMLEPGWLVHPIDEKIYGVYSSPEKVERRLEILRKYFPKARLKKSTNLAKGDYIVYLEG